MYSVRGSSMVKIFERNDKLYLERAGKETQLESVTIHSDKSKGTYKLTVFPIVATKSIRHGQEYIQKTYPLVSINLEKIYAPESVESRRGVYYHKKTKNYYINYYVV